MTRQTELNVHHGRIAPARTTSGFGQELDALVLFYSSKTKAGKQVPPRYYLGSSSMVPAGARSTKLMPRPVTFRTAIRKWVAVESSFGNLAILQPDRLWQQLRVFLREVDVLARGKRRPRFS